ncbi:hypothetical protein INP83_11470 [Mucilaginibacter sp. 21P]|uniref:hypothetical protein n=1 Tax=Mucilaginibacter sp. 21P TaxID=2778902 RepID=UPI001C59EEE7|nr:hypothetical protein [Mucilaginibacter sp. 21P]QXV63728.1 hypothetical protein INP83_11470 [Mucilaginibacter sp. 21P]
MDNLKDEIDKGNLGEEFVNNLAYKTYLKYWCYPGPCDEFGDRKEIVDLMILFRDTCLLISVKNYEFNGKYDRYFRNTLEKATSQLYGAERKLYGQRDIFIRHPDRPEERFEKEKHPHIIRLIVNLGEMVRFYPFHTETNTGGYVTVMDKEAFVKLIGELDTIPDLIEYLNSREKLLAGKSAYLLPGPEDDFDVDTANQFFSRDPDADPTIIPRLILSGTEADLLAHYLRNERKFSTQLTDSTASGVYLDLNGGWDGFIAEEKVKQKKAADKFSYFIDKLVENELLRAEPDWAKDMSLDLLSLNRFERRILGKSFLGFVQDNAEKGPDYMARRYQKIGNTAFLFLWLHKSRAIPQYLPRFLEIAAAAHLIHDGYQPSKLLTIGTSGFMQGFYFYYLPEIQFPSAYEQDILTDCKTLGWFTDMKKFEYTESEHPKT